MARIAAVRRLAADLPGAKDTTRLAAVSTFAAFQMTDGAPLRNGSPTLGTADADSSRQLIEHGRSGVLVSAPDADAFGAEIATLIADPQRRQQLGSEARKASARFSWDAASDSVLAAYRSLLSGRPAPA